MKKDANWRRADKTRRRHRVMISGGLPGQRPTFSGSHVARILRIPNIFSTIKMPRQINPIPIQSMIQRGDEIKNEDTSHGLG